ncbi:MAG: hypothetical protein ACP5G4_09310 [bacterium]
MAKETHKVRSLKDVRDAIAKGLAEITSEDLVVSHLDFGENAEGYRWELHRGEVPFWVDLMRFKGQLDLLVAYSIMFVVPEKWDESKKAELYRFLLSLNDFSQSWDTKFFLKGSAVVLCASRAGDEITKESSRFLVDSFSRFAQILSQKVSETYGELTKLTVKTEADNSVEPGQN